VSNIFLIVLLLSLIALVVGVINPRWAMPWASNPSRGKAAGLYFALILVALIGVGATTDTTEQTATAAKPAEQQSDGQVVEQEPEPAAKPEPLSPVKLVATRMPAGQKSFLAVIAEAANAYEDAPNELVKSSIDKARRVDSREFTSNGQLKGWVGILERLGTNGDGNGIIVIRANPKTTFQTWNNAFSDINDKTLIPNGSELYNAVAQLAEGTPVIFSGRLLGEGSTTEEGSVMEPEFIVRFSSIEPVH